MKAILLKKIGEINQLKDNLIIEEFDNPIPGEDDVLIKLHYASLNHRDLWITKGLYSGIKLPVILGSDGAGIIEDSGSNVTTFKKGEEVIINPTINWGDNENFQNKNFRILGLPDNGTLAQYITVNQKYVFQKPFHLTLMESAAIPLAGLTAYKAVVVKAEIKKNENVLITGIGGGVASFAMIFAKALGANIYFTSGSNEKIKFAKDFGATDGFNYKNELWDEVLSGVVKGGIDAVIDGTGGSNINKIIKFLNYGGRIVNYGATAGNVPNFDIRKLYWKQIKLLGTTMGSDKDFREMINFVIELKLKPIIDKVYEFNDYIQAFERMNRSEQIGKIIIKI